jgi:hypothetical protein
VVAIARVGKALVIAAIVGVATVVHIESAVAGKVASATVQLLTYQEAAGYASISFKSVRSFSLRCAPTGGTLPFADRLCQDIELHPHAMLNPRSLPPGGCSPALPSAPFTYEVMRVVATVAGRTSRLSTGPGLAAFCPQPGVVAAAVYWYAAHRDVGFLNMWEPLLHCDEDPRLFVRPTPLDSVDACMLGLWTPRFERLIQDDTAVIGERVVGGLFPRDVGTRTCMIPVRGSKTAPLRGQCSVSVAAAQSATPGVTFTESWPSVTGGTKSHWWVLYLPKGQPPSVFQGGPRAPQLGG